jgi:D-alanyl-D-alanine carboxypeptidase
MRLLAAAATAACTLVFAGAAFAQSAPDFAATLRPLLLAKMKELSTPGAIVLVEAPGKGTWLEGLGVDDLSNGTPMSADNHMRIGSVTKTLTATAVLMLVDEGKIGLDDPVSKYRPDIPNGDNITVRQMMNMTSGLFNVTEDVGLNAMLDADPQRIWNPREAVAIAFQHPPYFAPGANFHYANTNYDLLGQIVENVTWSPLPRVFEERIFAPLGMAQSQLPAINDLSLPEPFGRGYMYSTNVEGNEVYAALVAGGPRDKGITAPAGTAPRDATQDSISYTYSSGGAISTARDLQIWAKALATGALLKPETHKAQVTWTPHQHYGLGITEVVGPFLGHTGAIPGYQTLIGHDPQSGATIVVLANLLAAPNVPFIQSLPADELAGVIYEQLFKK